MKIMIFGASGFIGRHLSEALQAAGHEVLRGVRIARRTNEFAIDFAQCVQPADMLPMVREADVVINAVGILNEGPEGTFDEVHRDGPIALFDACEQAGVMRVIHISALGADSGDEMTPYMRSKRQADDHLMRSSLAWSILRPSLVVGMDGASSIFFRHMASFPVIGLPGNGEQQLQPIHIDDVSEAVNRLVEHGAPIRQIVELVGPAPMTYRTMLLHYRSALGMSRPLLLPVPMPVMKAAARLMEKLPGTVLSTDNLRMLEQGNVGNPEALKRLLGRMPVGPAHWFTCTRQNMLRAEAVSNWTLPLMRITLASVWMITGILSLGIYPVTDSLALLSKARLQGLPALVALYGAALLDLALGLATLAVPSRRLWRLQAILILGYMLIISIFLPAFWLHPFGPILKNLPILAILLTLDAHQTE